MYVNFQNIEELRGSKMECRLRQNNLSSLWSNLTEARISNSKKKKKKYYTQILFTCISFQCKEADLCFPGFSKENSLLKCYDSDIVILQWGYSLLQCRGQKSESGSSCDNKNEASPQAKTVFLWWTLGYTCLFQFWFPRCACPAVELLGHKAVIFPVF